jgi:hypothetical protein
VDDKVAWERVARFHNLLDQYVSFLQRGPNVPYEASQLMVKSYPRLINIGRDAERRLESLV